MNDVCVSVVTHGHDTYLSNLMGQLTLFSNGIDTVIITHNIQSSYIPNDDDYPFMVINIVNDSPKGFSENHNHAFKYCFNSFYCILNPDVTIKSNVFNGLKSFLVNTNSSVVAPAIVNMIGEVEDSARYFPSPGRILSKVLGFGENGYNLKCNDNVIYPDWIAGMCMFFRADAFSDLGGFDDSFYLYYEDVDICLRAWKRGYRVSYCPDLVVFHDAQKSSHSNLRYFRWHIVSMFRFFVKHLGRFPYH